MGDVAVLSARQTTLLAGAAEWRASDSDVRRSAREVLRESEWPAQSIEAALESVLSDADEVLRAWRAAPSEMTVLAILPGNIVGPALASAYCAAAAGARLMLKSSSRELHLADVIAAQFERLGPPVAGTLQPMRWSGGDVDTEAKIFPRAQRIVVFGDDATVEDVKRRAPERTSVIGYGSAYSVGFVPARSDLNEAAVAGASDVALFDQRGCLSPQTIYVEGDEARAILFARALDEALRETSRRLPRARASQAEQLAVAELIRRLHVRALPPVTHALATVYLGPQSAGMPSHIVAVESYSSPTCAGFGRVVIVKPCQDVGQAAAAAKTLGSTLDTVGIAGKVPESLRQEFSKAGALRVCELGLMQRPPFGYRPRIADFVSVDAA